MVVNSNYAVFLTFESIFKIAQHDNPILDYSRHSDIGFCG